MKIPRPSAQKQKTKISPLFLLADSRLLFMNFDGQPLFNKALQGRNLSELKAAYIGVSNDDDPAFYQMFEAAMKQQGIENYLQISKDFGRKERHYLEQANLILLAGGEIFSGWQIIRSRGMNNIITRRYYEGALLAGVSAGAVQLGLYGYDKQNNSFETLKLAPLIIGVHEEKYDWAFLIATLENKPETVTAIGISAGAGLIYYPDHSIQALAKPLNEFRIANGKLSSRLIFQAV